MVTSAFAACSPSRDVVPETRDVRMAAPPASAAPNPDGYSYVARRPHGAIGLAGMRFIAAEEARRVVDRLADELETCSRRLEQQGTLVEGAARLVAVSGQKGNADVSDMQLAPGGPVAANALLCIVAPVRSTPFPNASDGGIPAVLVEATWAPFSTTAGRDASAP
jgi:hypothetical protein